MAARHLRSGLPLLCAHLAASESAAVAQVSRGFASQVGKPAGKQIKVPEALYGGTRNYASALFLSAAKANVLDKVESEIRDVVEASKKSPMFSQFIGDSSVPKETRVKAITEIFSEAGFSDVTKNFLAVLADNGRLRYIERIAERFVDFVFRRGPRVSGPTRLPSALALGAATAPLARPSPSPPTSSTPPPPLPHSRSPSPDRDQNPSWLLLQFRVASRSPPHSRLASSDRPPHMPSYASYPPSVALLALPFTLRIARRSCPHPLHLLFFLRPGLLPFPAASLLAQARPEP